MRFILAFVLVVTASCDTHDNSADTDRSGSALTKARSELTNKGRDVTTREAEIEREKRALIQQQQALVDQEKALTADRQQLGSARESLAVARESYSTGVAARLAKLDASVADLAKQTDAASKDAVVGIHARREQLAQKLATVSSTLDQDWAAYTRDVDTTFDAIERDLHDATR